MLVLQSEVEARLTFVLSALPNVTLQLLRYLL